MSHTVLRVSHLAVVTLDGERLGTMRQFGRGVRFHPDAGNRAWLRMSPAIHAELRAVERTACRATDPYRSPRLEGSGAGW